MKFLRATLIACSLLLSLPSFAGYVMTIYVANHSIHLAFGDDSSMDAEQVLSGSTLNPILMKDVATWSTNDSPSKTFSVILKGVSGTSEYKAIIDRLATLKPANVTVKIYAAGFQNSATLDENNKKTILKLLKDEHIFSKDVLDISYISELETSLGETTSSLQRTETHKKLFCGLLQNHFGFNFDLANVTTESDQVMMKGVIDIVVPKERTENTEPDPVCGFLWITTYGIVFFRKNVSFVIAEEESFKKKVLPEEDSVKGIGGLFDFGKQVVAIDERKKTGMTGKYGKYVNLFLKSHKCPEITGQSVVDRLVDKQLGYVNFGEFIGSMIIKSALDIGGTRDPKEEHARNGVEEFDLNSSDLCTEVLEKTKKKALRKYLSVLYLAKSIKKPNEKSRGVLVGEYSNLFFEDSLFIDDFLNDDGFLNELATNINNHIKKSEGQDGGSLSVPSEDIGKEGQQNSGTRFLSEGKFETASMGQFSLQQEPEKFEEAGKFDGRKQDIKDYFANHTMIFSKQVNLANLLHQYGSSKK